MPSTHGLFVCWKQKLITTFLAQSNFFQDTSFLFYYSLWYLLVWESDSPKFLISEIQTQQKITELFYDCSNWLLPFVEWYYEFISIVSSNF